MVRKSRESLPCLIQATDPENIHHQCPEEESVFSRGRLKAKSQVGHNVV